MKRLRRERRELSAHESATLRHAWLVRLQMLKTDAVWLLDPIANWPLSNAERSELAQMAKRIRTIALSRLVRARTLFIDTSVPTPVDKALRERIATLQSLADDLRNSTANWPLSHVERDQLERAACELDQLLIDIRARSGVPADELKRRGAKLDRRIRDMTRKNSARALVPVPIDNRPVRVLQLATA